MNTLDHVGYTTTGKLWIFIGFQWVLFGAQMVIRVMVPDEPRFVDIQRKRTEFIVSKVIDKVKDEDDDELMESTHLLVVRDVKAIQNSAPGM